MDQRELLKRTTELVDAWWQRQGLGIEKARGPVIAKACRWEAVSKAAALVQAGREGSFLLDQPTITKIADRCISGERNRYFGKIPVDEATWRKQVDQARDALLAGARLGDMGHIPSRLSLDDLDEDLPTAGAA